jgi:hypothetical protein
MTDFLDYLCHHGTKGQKWGVRHGPPYPLKGNQIKRVKYKVSSKGDQTYKIKKGQVAQTLSYDPNRTKDADMYFASLSQKDKDFYKALFNKKIPNDAVDENGKRIGPAYYLKYNIKNQAKSDVKVANERDGVEAFMKLMENSRDFQHYVLDEGRLSANIDERRAKFPGYKESLEAIEKARKHPDRIDAQEAAKMYRMFNYAIPAESNDSMRQRARFFKELKSQGYGAVLDTNDAVYGKFKMEDPVIIFDQDAMNMVSADRVTGMEKTVASVRSLLDREIANLKRKTANNTDY